MREIFVRKYCDGFYTLSAKVGENTIKVTYSDTTKYEDAHRDFVKIIEEAEQCRTQ